MCCQKLYTHAELWGGCEFQVKIERWIWQTVTLGVDEGLDCGRC